MLIGGNLGPYRIVEKLGEGGMGQVYRARDTRLDRDVAIKVLPPALAGDSEFRERFEREARMIARLNDARICALYDFGRDGEVSYLVMEYVDGTSLSSRLERGPLPIGEALGCAIDIARGLDRAHRAGVVHRDLKPANIMLTKAGTKLLDFGIAKTTPAVSGVSGDTAAATRRGAGERTDPTRAAQLTAQGTILGTVLYMAPEQLEGKNVDPRADIWSFGCVLYEMVTGRRAFAADSQIRSIGAILRDEPPPPSSIRREVPAAVDRIVARCLAKEPDDRWQSAGDLAATLALSGDSARTRAPEGHPAAAGHWRNRVLIGALALAVVVLSVVLLLRPTPTRTPMRTSILPPPGSEFVSTWIDAGPVEISPDGSRLVFVARTGEGPNQLWVHTPSASASRSLAGTEGARRPFWSPDGQKPPPSVRV